MSRYVPSMQSWYSQVSGTFLRCVAVNRNDNGIFPLSPPLPLSTPFFLSLPIFSPRSDLTANTRTRTCKRALPSSLFTILQIVIVRLAKNGCIIIACKKVSLVSIFFFTADPPCFLVIKRVIVDSCRISHVYPYVFDFLFHFVFGYDKHWQRDFSRLNRARFMISHKDKLRNLPLYSHANLA